jgi:hypothetical protein
MKAEFRRLNLLCNFGPSDLEPRSSTDELTGVAAFHDQVIGNLPIWLSVAASSFDPKPISAETLFRSGAM